ncbi:MAG: hypothetical protein V3T77_04680, partial [Planctomycetota bacterium]
MPEPVKGVSSSSTPLKLSAEGQGSALNLKLGEVYRAEVLRLLESGGGTFRYELLLLNRSVPFQSDQQYPLGTLLELEAVADQQGLHLKVRRA